MGRKHSGRMPLLRSVPVFVTTGNTVQTETRASTRSSSIAPPIISLAFMGTLVSFDTKTVSMWRLRTIPVEQFRPDLLSPVSFFRDGRHRASKPDM